MRGVSRLMVAVSIVTLLAVPAEAKPRDGGRWFEKRVDPIVKVLKRLLGSITSEGDGLIDPRP
ncbi:MAG: hypothetical protein ACJ74H_14885 [Thermoanaerobaculia bacterium]